MIYKYIYKTPKGFSNIIMNSDGENLTGLWFEGSRDTSKHVVECEEKDLKIFTNDKIIYEIDKSTNKLSDRLLEDLRKRGMKFVGSTIIYSYLQAIGVIYSHDTKCFMYKDR